MRPAHHLHGEEAGKISARFAIQPQQESSPPGCFSCFFYPSAQQIGKESLMEKQELDALLAELSAQLRELGIPLGKHIAPQVEVNTRAQTLDRVLPSRRLGAASAEGRFTIQVPQAAGGWAPAARHPSPRAAPHLLRLPEPRQALEGLRPAGGGGPGGGNHPHRPPGGPGPAPAPRAG